VYWFKPTLGLAKKKGIPNTIWIYSKLSGGGMEASLLLDYRTEGLKRELKTKYLNFIDQILSIRRNWS